MRLVEFLNITETPDEFLQDARALQSQLRKIGVHLTLTKADEKTVELDYIEVRDRNEGHGARAMKALIALADNHGTRVMLYPVTDSEEDFDLSDWYGRLGFGSYFDEEHGSYMLYDPSG